MTDNAYFENLPKAFIELQKAKEITYRYNKRQLVYQHDKVKLFHYQPLVKKPHALPLLVVFATVNRSEILDLYPEQSFIHGLLASGLDVYLIDWGFPEAADKTISFSDYISHYLNSCVEFVSEQTKNEKINLLGICQGGVMSLCYTAYSNKINKLVLISTPIDFKTKENTISKMLNQIDIKTLVTAMGNVSGAWLTGFFISLRPFELVGKKYLRFMDKIENTEQTEKFLYVEKWLHDAPDQTGASFLEFADNFYRQNNLMNGNYFVKDKRIDLTKITTPILNVIAEQDEIVPPSASLPLKNYIKNYNELYFPSGHIGIYVSEKVGSVMPKAIANWLKK